jgi:cupin 2 domain-containing protein
MTGNVFSGIPAELPNELLQELLHSPNVRIERIVSHGHASPADFWYDQDEHEWVLLVQGAARLAFAGETVELRAGDYLSIPAHRRHRVEWTSPAVPTIWLAVFYRAD